MKRIFQPVLFIVAMTLIAQSAVAQSVPILGKTLSGFSVLAGVGGITNTPTEYPHAGFHIVHSNNMGAINTEASGIAGFYGAMKNSGPGIGYGSIYQGVHSANLQSFIAQNELVRASATLRQMCNAATVEFGDMSGMTLAPGVYSLSAPAYNLGVGKTLILDGGGNAKATWVFLATSSIIRSTDSQVRIVNAGAAASVYWDAASSITMNVGAKMVGNFIADTSITLLADVDIACGRLLARTGTVTLSSDTVTSSKCQKSADGKTSSDGLNGEETLDAVDEVNELPEPHPASLLTVGLLGMALLGRRQRRASAANVPLVQGDR